MARIMIVDDSMMMRNTLRRILEKAGHAVVEEAVNGQQAIDHYPKCLPDLVTMDITMPGLSGIDALKGILEYDPQANIIAVSALGQKHIVFEALQNGAKNYVLKPIHEDKLLSVLEMVLEQNGFAESH